MKRKVEVFTAGCPICDEAVDLAQKVACPDCEVTVYDLHGGCDTNVCREKATHYGVKAVPTVVVDGRIADCCAAGGVNAEVLRGAGIGQAAGSVRGAQ